MKYFFLSIAVVFLVSCGQKNPYAETENVEADYPVIPAPQKLEIQKGRFWVNNKTTIYASEGLENEAKFLQEYLKELTGIEVKTSNGKAENSNAIVLSTDESIANEEGYKLSITSGKIDLSGKNSSGVFYGLQTLRQLVSKQGDKGDYTIPDAIIEDAPRFAYRGMHLDVGRHFFPMDFIKKYIDLIALHKMNKFHWHLTEDQGWRLEIKKYPKLTEIGSKRAETAIKKHFPGSGVEGGFKGDGEPYGGFYTQEEAKEIVQYAKDRHITVIPEIEMPGHSLAALAAYPELGNGTGPYEVGKWWGVFEQIYAPKEETFKFLEDVLTEVMDIFPSEYIHIGGDEAPKKEWKESKQAQALIKELGLKDDTEPSKIDGIKHTKEEKLQSYFIARMEKFINSKGRQIIGWDEILEGGLAPNATVMSWRGEQGGITAAKQKHKVVMTPGDYCYFDHYQHKDTENEPFAICCLTPVEEVYSYNPTPKELTKEEQEYIWGAQGNVWTEYMKTPEHVEYMILPRMAALSEVVWSPLDKKDYKSFEKRMENLRKEYDRMNVNYAKHIFNE